MRTNLLINLFFEFPMNVWSIISVLLFMITAFFIYFLVRKVVDLFDTNDRINKKIKIFEKEINLLKSEIERKDKNNNRNQQINNSDQRSAVPPAHVPAEQETSYPTDHEAIKPSNTSEEIFYMPAPSTDGQFAIDNKSNVFKETISLYKFFVNKNNPNKAEFEFKSDNTGLRNAVNYPDRYLEPVCNINNAHNSNAKNIITIHKGFAEKSGDSWIVKSSNKAQIKYE